MHRLVLGLLCDLIRSHVNNVSWSIFHGFIDIGMTALLTEIDKK